MLDTVKENQTLVSRETFARHFAELFNFATAAEIARRIGVPHATVSNYLKGRLPSPEVLIKIANETSVSLNWLLAGVGAKFVTTAAAPLDTTPAMDTQTYTIFNEEALAIFIRRIAREELEDAIRQEYYADARTNIRDFEPVNRELVEDLGEIADERSRGKKKKKA